MSKLQGEKAQKFIAWLACVKGFLPMSMTIDEAAEIFERRFDELAKEAKDNDKEKH